MNIRFYIWTVAIILFPLMILDWRFDDKFELLTDGDADIWFGMLGVIAFWIIGLAVHNRRYSK